MRVFAFALMLLALACRQQEPAVPDQPAPTPPQTASSPETVATSAPEPAAPSCTSAPNRLCPSDEGPSDPTFAAYRDELRAAVKAKDLAKVKSMIDPAIRTDFGGGGGEGSFKPDWEKLEAALALGGSFRGEGADRMFWAPYVYANWPDAFDAFSYVAAVRDDAIVRASPDDTSAEVARLQWDIVELVQGPRHDTWRQVRTADRKEGWVRAADVRSPIDYRAGFSKRSGTWKMEAFVAGD